MTAKRRPHSDAKPAAAARIAPHGDGGYERGHLKKAHILATALRIFGTTGFREATTRQIADEAGVNLPALKYYFGGKEGLYLACAHEIVRRYVEATGPAIAEVGKAMQSPMDAATARRHLKQVLMALADLLMRSKETQIWTLFIQRELANPSVAFDVLYSELWKPGVELCAALIGIAFELPPRSDEARVRALLLIAGVVTFNSGRPVTDRLLGSLKTDEARHALVSRIIAEQIDQMGARPT